MTSTKNILKNIVILFLIALMSNAALTQSRATPSDLLQSAIDHLNLVLPNIGTPNQWSYRYAPATSDSSLGCGLIDGQTLSQMVVPYQITLTYDGLPYVYYISGDGSILVPCDLKIPGVTVTSTNMVSNSQELGVGGPIAQPNITVNDPAAPTSSCILTAIYANIRQHPNEDATILGQLTTGDYIPVIGTQMSEDNGWWQLENGGWVASWVSNTIGTGCNRLPSSETTTSGAGSIVNTPIPNIDANFVCEDALPPRLTIGQQALVTSGLPNNVRDMPGLLGRMIGQVDNNTVFNVIDGPVCEGGFVWWEVQQGDLIGWTAEGNGFNYWLQPFTT